MIKLLKYAKPVLVEVILTIILITAQVVLQLRIPNEMKDVSAYIAVGDTRAIWEMGGRMLLLSVGALLIAILVSISATKVGSQFGRNLRNAVFKKVSSFSVEEYDKFGVSSLITRTSNDVQQIQQIVIMGLRIGIQAPLTILVSIIYSSSIDLSLMLVLLVSIPIMLGVIGLVGFLVMPLMKVWQSKIDRSTLVLRENLTGVRVIRAFACEGEERKRYDEANRDLTRVTIKANRIMTVMMSTLPLVMNGTYLGVFIVGFAGLNNVSAAQFADSLSSIMVVAQYSLQIMSSVLMVAMIFVFYTRSKVSASRINEVLTSQNLILDPANPSSLKDAKIRGQLEFRNVSFYFPGAEEATLENISFVAKKGETTAIIGSTGSGKSTIVNLIPRFFDATHGSVLIDGVNVKDIRQKELREHIGFVPQKALLFSGTIKENLKYGNENASDEDLMVAAEVARAKHFILKKDKGFDSEVSQGGKNFSGGQKQRLCIARALVRKAEVYVFDDSFSALDFKTDVQVRHALKDYTKDSTVIIVGQRVASIMDADNIIVLNEGKIVGQGTHYDLLSSCSVYQEIVRSQLDPEEVENTIKLTQKVREEGGE